uniref:Uncharacterized protein n=1 Tax=Opuntia streptacantha TaxID=393608 RepID=A0A7C8ZDB1_OPUST
MTETCQLFGRPRKPILVASFSLDSNWTKAELVYASTLWGSRHTIIWTPVTELTYLEFYNIRLMLLCRTLHTQFIFEYDPPLCKSNKQFAVQKVVATTALAPP